MNKIYAADAKLLGMTAAALVFLHEWLDLTRADVLKIQTIVQLATVLPEYIHDRNYAFILIWMLASGLDWIYASTYGDAPSVNLPSSRSGVRSIMVAMFLLHVIVLPFQLRTRTHLYVILDIAFYLNMTVEMYVRGAPKPPSDRGRRRKEFMENLNLRKFEPLPIT